MSSAEGYAAELQRIEEDIAKIGAPAISAEINPDRVTRCLYLLYKRASITGDLAGLSALERDIGRAIPLLAHPGDLYLLKAHTALKLHKLADAHSALLAVTAVHQSNEGQLLRADLDFQHGRYRLAQKGYKEVLQAERSWGALARLAYLSAKMGDEPAADRLYEEAQDQLTAKEMRSYAWLEVQRGFLDFAHGRHDAARSHYRRADAAYPGYWLVDEHVAELLGAEGEYEAAIAILERIVSAVRRPELEQAIGELYDLSGRGETALRWKRRAQAAYIESARRGEVHYYHHLADYCSDVAENGSAAVEWAFKDLCLRDNFATQAALAWAFYRDGRAAEGARWIDRALSSGVVDAQLFYRAGKIYHAAGDKARSREHLERATHLNPAVSGFHLHH
jgi:tetratricopeptide (TPR) repeat protein